MTKATGESETLQIDRRLAALAVRARNEKEIEYAWELFRLEYFPGWKPARVASALATWSRRHAINVAFRIRKEHDVATIFMVLSRGAA
jgi:hypothetical protein